MKSANFNSFLALLEEMGQAFAKAVRYALGALATMSWPALMASAIALALAISIVPLALTLFVIFMLVKLIIGACFVSTRRDKSASPLNADDKRD